MPQVELSDLDRLRTHLREVREEAGLTQGRLATLLGVSRPQIVRVEGGTREPTTALVTEWFKACGYSLSAVQLDPRLDQIASAASRLPAEDVEQVTRLVAAWSGLPDAVKRILLAAIPNKN